MVLPTAAMKKIQLEQKIGSTSLEEDGFIFVDLLGACAERKDVHTGSKLHNDIIRKGLLRNNQYLASALVNMYAKCGILWKAHQVHYQLCSQSIVSWNALISGYTQCGKGHGAMACFEHMQKQGIGPSITTFICILKACGSIGAIEKGEWIHDEIVNRGWMDKSVQLGNALVSMYAKCGALMRAKKVVEELSVRNVVTWSSLIAGYTQQGQGHEAMDCFVQMESEGISPNVVTFACILKACGIIGDSDKGKHVHYGIVSKGLLEKNVVLGTALVDMYAKCGLMREARQVHHELYVHDVVSWSALIAGYAQQGQGHDALNCFERMQDEGLTPDVFTFTCALNACGSTGAIAKGKQIHDLIVSKGLLEESVIVGNSLVDMYARFGMLTKAHQVHCGLRLRNLVSWNALITGYTQSEQHHEAMDCFERMQSEGLSPSVITFTCILKACGSVRAIDKGRQIHYEIVRRDMLEKDVMIGNGLVDMYARCGELASAQQVLEELPIRNVVTWSTLIAGYAQQGQDHKALHCFESMENDGLSPNTITFTCILKVCGSVGAIDKGIRIHDVLVCKGLLEKDTELGNALVDMYVKCGMLAKAKQVLEDLPIRNMVSWSVLISGYAQRGLAHEAVMYFELMQDEGLSPDAVTFLCVLNACSQAGLLEEVQMLFTNMIQRYGILPKIEHHTCMVVILGCAGHLAKAMSVIKTMPSSQCPLIWLALLSACRKWGNLKLGRLAFDKMMELDKSCAAAYVIMTNMYAALGMREDAENIEAMRHSILKEAGQWCVR